MDSRQCRWDIAKQQEGSELKAEQENQRDRSSRSCMRSRGIHQPRQRATLTTPTSMIGTVVLSLPSLSTHFPSSTYLDFPRIHRAVVVSNRSRCSVSLRTFHTPTRSEPTPLRCPKRTPTQCHFVTPNAMQDSRFIISSSAVLPLTASLSHI